MISCPYRVADVGVHDKRVAPVVESFDTLNFPELLEQGKHRRLGRLGVDVPNKQLPGWLGVVVMRATADRVPTGLPPGCM